MCLFLMEWETCHTFLHLFFFFYALQDACPKGSEQLADWCLHYRAQYLKQINRRFSLRLELNPSDTERRAEGKKAGGKGKEQMNG